MLALTRSSEKRKKQAIDYLGGACLVCGYNSCIAAIDFHHVDPTVKKFQIAPKLMMKNWWELRDELDKCVLLCANCHREYHYSEFDLDFYHV